MTGSKRVYALIAAAGKGSRLGAPVPKAFVPLQGATLVERSVRAMMISAVVDEIIVLVSPDMEHFATTILERSGLLDRGNPNLVPIRLVHGGSERAQSVWEGLKAIAADHGVVLVHDSARALTPPGMIARVAKKVLEGSDAVIPVIPVADTIKRIGPDKTVVETPSRATLRSVQTPQGFDLAKLRAANERYFALDEKTRATFVPTDDASLMEWAGHPVVTVNGDPMAFKVTTPFDYILARHITGEAEPTIFEVPGDIPVDFVEEQSAKTKTRQ